MDRFPTNRFFVLALRVKRFIQINSFVLSILAVSHCINDSNNNKTQSNKQHDEPAPSRTFIISIINLNFNGHILMLVGSSDQHVTIRVRSTHSQNIIWSHIIIIDCSVNIKNDLRCNIRISAEINSSCAYSEWNKLRTQFKYGRRCLWIKLSSSKDDSSISVIGRISFNIVWNQSIKVVSDIVCRDNEWVTRVLNLAKESVSEGIKEWGHWLQNAVSISHVPSSVVALQVLSSNKDIAIIRERAFVDSNWEPDCVLSWELIIKCSFVDGFKVGDSLVGKLQGGAVHIYSVEQALSIKNKGSDEFSIVMTISTYNIKFSGL